MTNISREKLEGMTTNERLWETDQFAAFEDAQRRRDFEAMRLILRSIYVDEPSIEGIIEETRNSDAWNSANGFQDWQRG